MGLWEEEWSLPIKPKTNFVFFGTVQRVNDEYVLVEDPQNGVMCGYGTRDEHISNSFPVLSNVLFWVGIILFLFTVLFFWATKF